MQQKFTGIDFGYSRWRGLAVEILIKKAAILATVVLGRMLSGFLPDSVMKKLLTLLTRGLLFS